MQSVNVRISSQRYQISRDFAQEKGQTTQALVDQALEDLRRRMLEATNEAFAALETDSEAWRTLGKTLADGIEKA